MKLLASLFAFFVFSSVVVAPAETQAIQCPGIKPFCTGFGESPCCECTDINHCEWSCCVKS